jgi:hypothetical protein
MHVFPSLATLCTPWPLCNTLTLVSSLCLQLYANNEVLLMSLAYTHYQLLRFSVYLWETMLKEP